MSGTLSLCHMKRGISVVPIVWSVLSPTYWARQRQIDQLLKTSRQLGPWLSAIKSSSSGVRGIIVAVLESNETILGVRDGMLNDDAVDKMSNEAAWIPSDVLRLLTGVTANPKKQSDILPIDFPMTLIPGRWFRFDSTTFKQQWQGHV